MDRRAEQDPVVKLSARLEKEAQRLNERLRNRKLPRDVRSRGRKLLRSVFVAVESAPADTGNRERRAWVKAGRAVHAQMLDLGEELDLIEKPPPSLYSEGRLGVIRVVEPIRVRFLFGRLGRVEDFERFTMLTELEARVEWLWERLRQARPDLFEPAAEERKVPVYRDENELVWGKVQRS